MRNIKSGCLTTSIKLSVFKSDPGEVEVKNYLKHREFRVFCEKNQKVSECVSGGPRQNSAKLDPLQQCDFRKNTKSESFVYLYWAPKGATFPEGVI